MGSMLKAAACAVTVLALGGVLRRYAPEFSLLLVLMAGVWMLSLAARGLCAVVDLMRELAGLAQLSSRLLEPVLKTVLLSLVTRVTAELCRASGEGGMASFVEITGTALALTASLPLVRAVVELMGELLI